MNRIALIFGGIILATICTVVVLSQSMGHSSIGRVLFVLPERDFDYFEFSGTKDILEKNSIEMTLASTVVGEITDHVQGRHRSEILIKDVDLDDYDMVCIVGGNGMKLIEDNKDVHQLLKNAKEKNMLISAICYGPVVLARSGILNGIESTVYQSDKNRKILVDNGAVASSEKIVVSGRILTGAGPEDTAAFAEKMVEILKDSTGR